MITCPICGEIEKADVKLYDETLKKQNILISPVRPTCKLCGTAIQISNTANSGNVIVLNGTCGSGKTTIAELLVGKGWLAIDGDCAIQSLRHKTGRKQYEWKDLIDEIICEIDVLSLFSKSIVISHVVMLEDFENYIQKFESRNLRYKFILLKPEYKTCVERCQTRTCHTTVTPEQWIKHFYDNLVFDNIFEIVDNTNMTPRETMDHILKLPFTQPA